LDLNLFASVEKLMQGPPGRSAVIGALLWLIVSVATGYAVVVYLGDYGSVLQLLTGAVIGTLGAVAHIAVCLVPRLRPLGFMRRALVTWLLAYVPFIALALILINPARASQWNASFWSEVVKILVPYTGLPMIALAILVAFVTSTRSARR
jgi:hypothetical protein